MQTAVKDPYVLAHIAEVISISICKPYWFLRLFFHARGARALQLRVLAMTERALVLRVSSPAETGARHNFYFPSTPLSFAIIYKTITIMTSVRLSRNGTEILARGSAKVCHCHKQTVLVLETYLSICRWLFLLFVCLLVRNRARGLLKCFCLTLNVCLQTKPCKATSRAAVQFGFASVQQSMGTLANVYVRKGRKRKNLRSSVL